MNGAEGVGRKETGDELNVTMERGSDRHGRKKINLNE